MKKTISNENQTLALELHTSRNFLDCENEIVYLTEESHSN
jgi:hypothetical protein